ncbi:MAG: TonB-dependent receptor [Gammaproteobacteria bacterium]|nr:TonB-dependent receptor [Gammaproteobacteria bacterium]
MGLRYLIALLLAGPASAQSVADAPVLEVVVTTATKKGEAQAAQDVATAVSVLTTEYLVARQATDIEDLSYALPNVALDGIGTGKGIANFSIRGLGVAGSIPSIDPTVGVFVDGVYLGMNYGVIVDMLDLEAVEVLRGPQGLLFGRNVTGGAVLLRSRRPSGSLSGAAALRVETGLDRRLTGSIENASADGRIKARLSASARDDAGWFRNAAPQGGHVGAERARVLRPVLTWTPSDALDVTVTYERGTSDGDGPATQNRRRFGGFGLAIDEPGFSAVDWQHAIVEANRRALPGSGQVTNVFGWRSVGHESLADIDSTAEPIFHLLAFTEQEQVSNELRYTGWFRGRWQTTLGGYVFAQDIRYRERRALGSTWGAPFGGDQEHWTAGVFWSNEFELADGWILNVGGRYTVERKDVEVATAGNATCVADAGIADTRCRFDFRDGDRWRNLTPKVGLQRWLGSGRQFYGHYTRGFRSGGYNLRNTSPVAAPGPFDEEEQDAFEVGFKAEVADGRGRLNVAAFHSIVTDLQRQVTRADATAGAFQVTANTADATIRGIEAEIVLNLSESVRIEAFLGLADGRYDRVRHDLDGDGSTFGDERLALPRLAPLSYGLGVRYGRDLGGFGRLTARLDAAHRDDSEITDDNRGTLDGGELVAASLELAPSSALSLTLYARNLLDTVFRRSDFDLSGLVDSTYSPLKEGRVVGLAINGRFDGASPAPSRRP